MPCPALQRPEGLLWASLHAHRTPPGTPKLALEPSWSLGRTLRSSPPRRPVPGPEPPSPAPIRFLPLCHWPVTSGPLPGFPASHLSRVPNRGHWCVSATPHLYSCPSPGCPLSPRLRIRLWERGSHGWERGRVSSSRLSDSSAKSSFRLNSQVALNRSCRLLGEISALQR